MQNWVVVVMGLVTVFVVLILIIGLCWLLGLACRGSSVFSSPTSARSV